MHTELLKWLQLRKLASGGAGGCQRWPSEFTEVADLDGSSVD